MTDIRQFVEAFIDAERMALVATHSEADEADYRAALDSAAQFLASGPGSVVTLGFGRPAGDAAAGLISRDAAQEQFQPRTLFAIATYELDGQPVHVAFVGSPRDKRGRRFDRALVVAERNGDAKIVGMAGVDPFAEVTPLPWEPLGGRQVPLDASPIRVEGVQRPTNDVHAAEYDRLVQSARERSDG